MDERSIVFEEVKKLAKYTKQDIENIRWILFGNIVPENALKWAATNGHLEIVKFLHKKASRSELHYAISEANLHSQLEVVKWAFKHVYLEKEWPELLKDTFFFNPRLKIIEWLIKNVMPAGSFSKATGWLRPYACHVNEYKVTKFLQKYAIKRVYFRAWMAMRGKKILWRFRLKSKFYIHQAIRGRPPYGVDYLRDMEQANTLFT